MSSQARSAVKRLEPPPVVSDHALQRRSFKDPSVLDIICDHPASEVQSFYDECVKDTVHHRKLFEDVPHPVGLGLHPVNSVGSYVQLEP